PEQPPERAERRDRSRASLDRRGRRERRDRRGTLSGTAHGRRGLSVHGRRRDLRHLLLPRRWIVMDSADEPLVVGAFRSASRRTDRDAARLLRERHGLAWRPRRRVRAGARSEREILL